MKPFQKLKLPVLMITLIRCGVLSLSLLAAVVQAEQVTFDVGKFSDRYYAKVMADSEELGEVFRPGTMRVYDKEHPKDPIITIESGELLTSQ
jgi:hypothetical protein